MLCSRQPRFLEGKSVQIANLLEVRLAATHWNRIKIVAMSRHRTYSTITRYCIFKLARRCTLRWTSRLKTAMRSVKDGLENVPVKHRHIVCLYGDDEKLIRLAAIELGLTLTAFVRLALELFLPTLAMEKHNYCRVSAADLTWEGIRFIESIQIFAVNGGGWPFSRNLSCIRFDIDTYW